MSHRPNAVSALAPAMLAIVLSAGVAGGAYAQARPGGTYPVKPVRIIVPYTPGGPTELLARTAGQAITEAWGQQVIVDHRPGASGNLGTAIAAKAPPDGYTLNAVGIAFSAAPALDAKLPFDPLRDFAPITLLATVNNLLSVHPSLPAKNVRELAALARARPGEISYASGGPGGAQHLAGELFLSLARVRMTHIPYKGSAPGLTALLGGEVTVGFTDMVVTRPHVRSGRLRGLAVTGAARSAILPELPTIAEAGVPGYAFTTWFALLAPAATPADIIARLNTEISKTLRSNTTRERLTALGAEPGGNSPQELGDFIRAEIAKWADIVKKAGIRGD